MRKDSTTAVINELIGFLENFIDEIGLDKLVLFHWKDIEEPLDKSILS